MELKIFDFLHGEGREPTQVSFSHDEERGNIIIHFGKDNMGPPVSHYLPEITKIIADGEGVRVLDVSWHVSNGSNFVSGFQVQPLPTIEGYIISYEDVTPFRSELNVPSMPEHLRGFDIDYYRENVSEIHERLSMPRIRRVSQNSWNRVIEIYHTAAVDSKVYLKTEYMGSDLDKNYDVQIVPTSALFKYIEQTDPDMIEHAIRKSYGKNLNNYLRDNRFDRPFNTGTFAVDQFHKRALIFQSGFAGIIKLMYDMEVEYFPVAYKKSPKNSEITDAFTSFIAHTVNNTSNVTPLVPGRRHRHP